LKLIIAGTRNYPLDKDQVACSRGYNGNIGCIIWHNLRDDVQKVEEVVSGCSGMIDQSGELWAALFNKKIKRFPAEWKKYGKMAGPIRNAQMANYADALLLIWDGKSKGSRSMKKEAEKAGIKIYEHVLRKDDER